MDKLKVLFVKYIPEIIEADTLYISEEFGTAIHLCPKKHYEYKDGAGHCGLDGDVFDAGELIEVKFQNVLPLKPIWKDGWDLTKHGDGSIDLNPSILNRGCKHHYFIKNSQIVWA